MDLPEFIGIDIASHAIRLAQVKYKSEDEPEITKLFQINIDKPTSNLKDIATKAYLKEKIIELLQVAQVGTKRVVIALPESVIFTKITKVPNLSEVETQQMLYYEIQNHIPIDPEDVRQDYITLFEEPNNPKIINIMLIAAPNSVINQYTTILDSAGLNTIAVETETIALNRIVGSVAKQEYPILIVDFGDRGVDIVITVNGKIVFSQSIATGSDALTNALANDYNISFQEAEQYKIKVGLDKNAAEGKIYKSFTPVLYIINNEIQKYMNYIRDNMAKFYPQKVVILGEGSKLIGLKEYFAENLKLETELINPIAKMKIVGSLKKQFPDESMYLDYSLAVGLAMKNE